MSDPAWALDLACRIAAVGAVIGALEQWRVRDQFDAGGVLSTPDFAASPWRRRITGRRALAALVAAQAGLGVVVLVGGVLTPWGWIALCLLAVAFVGLRWYRRTGGDGADQMTTIVFIGAALAAPAFMGELRVALGAFFIAAQALLAYATSGVAKLVSPVWRDGTGLAGILSTVDHGTPSLGAWLTRHPLFSKLGSWGTIAFECAFVLVLVLPPPLGAAVLVVGLLFHAACAVTMGLNSFLWAFPATYPCVWFAAEAFRAAAF